MKPILALLVSMGVAAGLPFTAMAQGYPSKPISLVIPFGAGGDSDLSGRFLAQYAAKYLGNASFVPLNRVGASGSIGTMQVRTALPRYFALYCASSRPERSESPPAPNGITSEIGFDG